MELGQLAFIALVLAGLRLAQRLGIPPSLAPGTRLAAAHGIGAAAAFWFFERLARFAA